MGRDISSIRIRRLLNLAVFLRKKGDDGAEVGDIMTHCEYTNKRALQEDIRLLREEYHAEITYKRSFPPRYCLTYEGEFLLSLSLNMNDITALSLGLGMASHFLPYCRNYCKDLWQKIASLIPDALIFFGEMLARTATMENPVSGIKPFVFEAVLKAIYEHEVLEIEYVSPYKDRQPKTHRISPYDLFFKAHSWYMTAGCEDRVLMFKLSRIQKFSVIEDAEYIPPPDDYNPDEVRQSSWYLKYGDLKHDIRLIVREPMATIVSETLRHPTQRITRIDDDTVELYACIPDLDEAARWILSCSPHITVKSPPELREKVCELADGVLKQNFSENVR
ncbi:MAG: WYL domain-containing protein [Synergistaceae bacterium]|nr:WYL domain-containing protein [Synergistaceae bacterium]